MFTGIIETLGTISNVRRDSGNIHITVASSIAESLRVDQSVSHNGICLTVVERNANEYTVTAIKETIEKTTIGDWIQGQRVNLERGMKLGDRLDGHLVQGHVDQTATCVAIREADGSWYFTFEFDASQGNVTIEKGSITVNGVSLTVVDSAPGKFSVAIIPYTYEHTNFSDFVVGTNVNLEFDVIGKYVARLYSAGRN
ncbi:MAG: riboflavin synthase [Flavobacterium sp.]|nr:MAG: riboflavin synthase [Flavobacterium sp.]